MTRSLLWTLFKLLQNRIGTENLQPGGQIWPDACFWKQKIVYSHTHSFLYCLWLLLHNGNWVVSTEPAWPAKPKIVNFLALYRKCLPTPDIEERQEEEEKEEEVLEKEEEEEEEKEKKEEHILKINFLGINCVEKKYSLGEKNWTEIMGLFSSSIVETEELYFGFILYCALLHKNSQISHFFSTKQGQTSLQKFQILCLFTYLMKCVDGLRRPLGM